ncbi:MAG: filamentous hemagglutinin N-terminal domain-containing protein [Sphingobacteriia bacterium]|nr:filamentous hemagglutinin N-terminal domain-containing protein [Sphingobacteriia bacterium]
MRKQMKAAINILTLITLILYNIFYFTSQCFAEENRIVPAEYEKNITIEKVVGDDAININNPNTEGLSVNDFELFNADQNNVVVKNNISDLEYKEQALSHNPNLSNEASHIVFDVKGNEPSNLKRDIIIAGKKAEFILVNPNGIFCKGCAFINAAKTTLTTEDGKGKILLDNLASDGDILAKSGEVELKAKSYIQGKATIQAKKLVDGSHLDAMYAKQIFISSDDTIKIKGKIEAQEKIEVNSKNYADLASSILASEKIDLYSDDVLDLEKAKIGAQKIKLYGKKELTAQKAVIIAEQGKFGSKNGIDLVGSIINLANYGNFNSTHLRNTDGTIISKNNINFYINELDNKGGQIIADNKIKVTSDNFFNNLGLFTANNIYLTIHNNTQNIYGHIIASNNLNYSSVGKILNNAGLIRVGSVIDIDSSELINSSDNVTKVEGEITANTILAKTNNFFNDGKIVADQIIEIRTDKFNNANLLESKQQLLLNTKSYHNTGKIKADNFFILGDFKEICDDKGDCLYEVSKNSSFDYKIGNEYIAKNGQMVVYAKNFNNDSRVVLNHSLYLGLYGNTFLNNNMLTINGDFIINDPIGAFINRGKILVNDGNMIIASNGFVSERYNGGNVDFKYYYNLGNNISNPWFYDINVISANGTQGNIDIISNDKAKFVASNIKADGYVNIITQNNFNATFYHDNFEYLGGPHNIRDSFEINADKGINITSLGGNLSIQGGNLTSNSNDITLNAQGDITIESISKFYIREDKPPANFYWKRPSPYNGLDLGFDTYQKTGHPTVVNDWPYIKANNGGLYLTSLGGNIITFGTKFNSSKEFKAEANKSLSFNTSKGHNYSSDPHFWGFIPLTTGITAPSVSLMTGNSGIVGNGLIINSLNGTDPVRVVANKNVQFETFKSAYCDKYGGLCPVIGPTNILSNKDIHLVSNNGNILLKGSSISSLGKVIMDAPNGQVDLISEAISTVMNSSVTKKGLFNKKTITKTWNEVDIYKAQVAGADGFEVNAKGIYTEGADVVAPQNKIIFNVQKEEHRPLKFDTFNITTVNTKGFTASGILGRMLEKNSLPSSERSPVRLHDTSPFISALKDAFNVRSPFDAAPAMNLAIESFHVLSDFAQNYKSNGFNAKMAGLDVALSQLGISHGGGLLFYPSGVGLFSSKYEKKETKQNVLGSNIYGKEYISNTDHTILEGATITGTDKVELNTKKLELLASEQITETNEKFNKNTVMFGKNSITGSELNRSAHEYINKKVYSYIRGNNRVNINTDELILKGGVIEGANTVVNAKNILIETLTDTYFHNNLSTSKSFGLSFYGAPLPIPNGSYSKGKSTIVNETSSEISGIKGLTVEVHADSAELTGGVIGGINSTIADITNVNFKDVKEKIETKQHGYGIKADGEFLKSTSAYASLTSDMNNLKQSTFGKSFSVYSSHKLEEGIVKSTIAGSNIEGLNNNLSKVKEWKKIKENSYSVMLPVPISEYKEIARNIKDIGDVFKDITNLEPLIPESTEHREMYEQGYKNGFTKDEINYVLEEAGLKEKPADQNGGTTKITITKFNKVGTDNLQLLNEYYGSYEQIPDKIKNGGLDKGKYFVKEGHLYYTPNEKMAKNHEIIVNASYKAGQMIKIANGLSEKYGRSYEASLYLVGGMFGGFTKAAGAVVKAKIGEQAFGEYIAKGSSYAIGKVAEGIRELDPYLSYQSAENLAIAAIIGGAATAGLTSDLKYVVKNKQHTQVSKFTKTDGTKYPENVANKDKLSKQLLAEQASSIFTKDGKLKPEIIRNAKFIDLKEGIKNQKVIEKLTENGSNIKDWGKFSTGELHGPSGKFEVHFYKNKITQEVNYDIDFKTITKDILNGKK